MFDITESFSEREAEILSHYFTSVDGPVFGLINLPEIVKAALFARYSRTHKSLRRLFLDEFYEELVERGGNELSDGRGVGVVRAERLFARVIAEYGDDSVAQLGGIHVACEQSSNILTKIIERGRLMSYLEQSTRYVPYGERDAGGHFRYHVPEELLPSSEAVQRYCTVVDRLFESYNTVRGEVLHYLRSQVGGSEVEDRAVRAASLDAARGLLPAGTLSNLGVFGSAQSYEQLIYRLRASHYGEARHYGDLLHDVVLRVAPAFFPRVDRADRGGVWVRYLSDRREATVAVLNQLGIVRSGVSEALSPSVRLIDFDVNGEHRIAEGIIFETVGPDSETMLGLLDSLTSDDMDTLFRAYRGERSNRRYRPGRAFERTRYGFEIVCDYGAFRDLQRHRLLTPLWIEPSTTLGYVIPKLVLDAGVGGLYGDAMDAASEAESFLAERFGSASSYVVPMGYLVRFRLEMNAREAMHLIELRSQASGHPNYRFVAQKMHEAIRNIAGHHRVAEAMSHVDHEEYVVGRVDAERNAEKSRSRLS